MSRRTVWVVVIVIMLLGGAGASYLGYRYFTRDRPALGTYRLNLPEGTTMAEVVDTERAIMGADEVLKEVIEELNLIEHWGFDSEAEALTHMRAKLIVSAGGEPDQLKVMYRDRSAELSREILLAINDRYVAIKRRQQLLLGP